MNWLEGKVNFLLALFSLLLIFGIAISFLIISALQSSFMFDFEVKRLQNMLIKSHITFFVIKFLWYATDSHKIACQPLVACLIFISHFFSLCTHKIFSSTNYVCVLHESEHLFGSIKGAFEDYGSVYSSRINAINLNYGQSYSYFIDNAFCSLIF